MASRGVMSPRALKNLMVTGGAGFIGCNFIRTLFEQPEFEGRIVNVDILTYAGNPQSLSDLDQGDRYVFEREDIRDGARMAALFEKHDIDTVVHLAAESHVDRSILGPEDFITTNIVGTFRLLEAARGGVGGKG